MSQVGNLLSKKQTVILAVASFAAVLLFLVNSYLPISRQETNAAGNTCIWLGTTSESFSDATNWTDCSATTPEPTDTISFTSAATRNLSLAEDITVAGIKTVIVINRIGNPCVRSPDMFGFRVDVAPILHT